MNAKLGGRTYRVTSAEIAARSLEKCVTLRGDPGSKAQLWVHTVAEVAMAQ